MANENPSEQLSSTSDYLLAIVENIGAAYLLETEDRKIMQVNKSFCDLFGIPVAPELLKGADCSEASQQAKHFFVNPEHFVSTTETVVKNKRKSDGEIFRMVSGITLLRNFSPVKLDENTNGFLWSYLDISKHIYLEELETQFSINYFVSDLYKENTIDDILWGIAQKSISQLNFVDCIIYLLDEQRQVLIQKAAWGPKTTQKGVIINPIEIPVGKGIVGTVAKTGIAEIIGDTSKDDRYILDDEFRLSEITVPILFEGKVIGIIDSEHPQANFFSKKHLLILSTIASLCAIKIQQLKEQQEKETEISQQKEFYERILNSIPADIAVFDKDHRYLFVNPTAIKDEELRKWIINKRDEDYCELKGKTHSIFKTRRDYFNAATTSKSQTLWEEQLKKADGSDDWVIRTFYPTLDKEGNTSLVIGYGINITERKKAELLREESEMKLNLIMDSLLDSVVAINTDGVINVWNSKSIEIFGWEKEEVIGKKISDLIIPDRYRKEHTKGLNWFSKTNDGPVIKKLIELPAKRKSGEEFPAEMFIIPIVQNNDTLICAFIRDITERKKLEQQKAKDEKKLRELFDLSPIMIFTHDMEYKILTANAATKQVLGIAPAHIIGKKLTDFAIAGEDDVAFTNYKAMLTNQKELYGIVPTHHASGELIYLLCNGHKVETPGEPPYIIAFCQDISKMVLAERNLKKAKEITEEMAKEKEQFWAKTSHELRTPLNGIIGISDLLTKTRLNPKQKKYVDVLSNSAQNLFAVINNVLDLERIKEGKSTVNPAPFSLKYKIDLLLDTFTPLAEKKELRFILDYNLSDTTILEGDCHKMAQILANLLSNAIKFTKAGSVTLSVTEYTPLSESDKMGISFVVKDTGSGIPIEKQSTIFEPFTQAHTQNLTQESGSGLGLTICKELTEVLGGSLSLESIQGIGSAFTLLLQFKKSQISEEDFHLPLKAENVLSNKSILLVEDSVLNQFIVKEMLQSKNVNLDIVENGKQAVDICLTNEYDLILMDIQMPVMNGIDALNAIREQTNNHNSHIPVISLSANALPQDLKKYKIAGFTDTLTKPFNELMLTTALVKHLSYNSISPTVEEMENVSAEPVSVNSISLNLTYLQETGKNNKDFIKAMLNNFVEQTPSDCTELERAVHEKDKAQISMIAHRLKYALRVIGASLEREEMIWIEETAGSEDSDQEYDDDLYSRTLAITETLRALIVKASNFIENDPYFK